MVFRDKNKRGHKKEIESDEEYRDRRRREEEQAIEQEEEAENA